VADLLDQGAAWLEDQRRLHFAQPVVYRRGAQTLEVLATIGRTLFEHPKEYGIVERTETRDYLITTAELVMGGNVVLPQRGDQIRETKDAKTFLYEVMAPGKEPVWRYSDPYRRTLRIHTKLVGTE
jgi:hypothetical protein